MAEKEHINNEEKALRNFLLDIDCLDALIEWTSRFNIFDILKITQTEIRHSNIISWLLNPSGNHGLHDNVLRGLVQYIVESVSTGNSFDVIDTLLMDYGSFTILREWKHIDILAVSKKEGFVVCIENKIGANEGKGQLTSYYKTVHEHYPNYRKIFLFLSPSGYEASDQEHWLSIGYQDILDIIENARTRADLHPKADLLISNYVEVIRREIVGDERLAQICAKIYKKHKDALDLIINYKPDRAYDLAEIFRRWATEMDNRGEIKFDNDKSNKSYTRFKTNTMSEILPDAEEALSGWNTKNYYFYEIQNKNGYEFYIQLSFSSKNIPESLRSICERINVHYPSKMQKEDWQWRTPFRTKTSKVDEEIEEEVIFAELDKNLDEIKAFEIKLKEKLDQKQ